MLPCGRMCSQTLRSLSQAGWCHRKRYEKARPLDRPVILDWDVSHPLMQYIRDLSTVAIVKATGVDPPTACP